MTFKKELRTENAVYGRICLLSKGRFGEIWKAKVIEVRRGAPPQLIKGTYVAVKIPKFPVAIGYAEAMDNYVSSLSKATWAEVQALTQLQGVPCVPALLDVGIIQIILGTAFGTRTCPVQFLVMELLDGQTLDKYLVGRYPGPGGVFEGMRSASSFFNLFGKIARCLHQIHRRQVIHGDPWYENVMVCSGAIRFIDFGQAVLRDLAPWGLPQKTGSHAFQPPDGSGRVDADVYALAGLGFYMATGQPPPRGSNDENAIKATVLKQIRDVNPGLIRENRGIADIIARGLRIDKERKIQTVDQVIADIELFESAGKVRRAAKRRTIVDDLRRHEQHNYDKMNRTLAHGVYDVVRTEDEISTFMTLLLSTLRPEDSYFSLSTAKFWRQGNVGPDGRFLSMTVLKAIQGVPIERVFLLQDPDLQSQEVRNMLLSQLNALEEVRSATRNFRGREPWFKVSYNLLSSDSYAKALKAYQNGGLIVAGGAGAVVMHSFSPEGRVTASRLDTDPNLFHTQRVAFDEHKMQAVPLTGLADLLKGRDIA
jgi:serine/threonine protein kinase